MDPEFLDIEAEHEHDERVTSISSKFVGALNVNKLERWIGELMRDKAEDLFRYKGVLAVKGMDQKFVFQACICFFQEYSVKKSLHGGLVKNVNVVSSLSVAHLDHEALEAGLMACKAEDLRFSVGDSVYANTGEFTEGKILKCWDKGNPYRVELQDAAKSNVWVPIDNDHYVRARN